MLFDKYSPPALPALSVHKCDVSQKSNQSLFSLHVTSGLIASQLFDVLIQQIFDVLIQQTHFAIPSSLDYRHKTWPTRDQTMTALWQREWYVRFLLLRVYDTRVQLENPCEQFICLVDCSTHLLVLIKKAANKTTNNVPRTTDTTIKTVFKTPSILASDVSVLSSILYSSSSSSHRAERSPL